MAREPGVDEVQFRRFDEPFAEVLVERRDQQDLCGRFEDAQPLRDGGDRYAERRGCPFSKTTMLATWLVPCTCETS